MTTTDNLYPLVAHDFERALLAVGPSQWQTATPCEGWRVDDLVRHVVNTHHRVLAMLDESTPVEIIPGDDVLQEWTAATTLVLDALSTPSLASTMVRARNGEQSFASLVGGLLTTDTLCHTWDLAHAIGADETLNPDAVARAHATLLSAGEAIRRPGGFGPAIESPPDADAQTKFLHYTGRRA